MSARKGWERCYVLALTQGTRIRIRTRTRTRTRTQLAAVFDNLFVNLLVPVLVTRFHSGTVEPHARIRRQSRLDLCMLTSTYACETV